MIKGHSKIELTDVNTGKVESFEDDNMVTNALQKIFTFGTHNASNALTSIGVTTVGAWQYLLGGLLLYEKKIDEDAENMFIPTNNAMIGNGCYSKSFNTNTTELGSYNMAESGLQEDGSIKMVYDYTTSQANGTISCACLTSMSTGYIGSGNSLSNKRNGDQMQYNTTSFFYSDASSFYSTRVCSGSSDMQNQFLLYAKNNSLYQINVDSIIYDSSKSDKHWYNTGNIVIEKYNINVDSVNFKYSSNNLNLIESYEVPIPDEIKTTLGTGSDRYRTIVSNDGENSYIVFGNSQTINNNSYFFVLKIDNQMKTTLYKMKNVTGENLKVRWGTYGSCCCVSNESLVIRAESSNNVYVIKLEDSTNIKKIEYTAQLYEFVNLNGSIFASENYSASSSYSYALYTIDIDSLKIYTTNGYCTVSAGRPVASSIVDVTNPLIIMIAYDSYNYFSVQPTGLYLATINNLAEPVTKTADKTMKVTYTLTFEE